MKLAEFESVAAESNLIQTSAMLDFSDYTVTLRVSGCNYGKGQVDMYCKVFCKAPNTPQPVIPAIPHPAARLMESPCEIGWTTKNIRDALFLVTRDWLQGDLIFDSITVKSSKCPLKPKDLKQLVIAAWCEVLGKSIPGDSEIKAKLDAEKKVQDNRRAEILQEWRHNFSAQKWNKWFFELNERSGGCYADNDLPDFRQVDLSEIDLAGASFYALDFQKANFEKANLARTRFDYGKCDLSDARFCNANLKKAMIWATALRVDFTGASLIDVSFCGTRASGAVFKGADLTNGLFRNCDIRGADFSTANLSEIVFEYTKYDEKTIFPSTFMDRIDTIVDSHGRPGLIWTGKGPQPVSALHSQQIDPSQQTAQQVVIEEIDFVGLVAKVKNTVEQSRFDQTMKMLKSQKFQLFSEVSDQFIAGVIKSQTDANLVYCCQLCSNGNFSCSTQNLRACGGLRGVPCKHLLVLILGLAKAEQIDPTTVSTWMDASISRKPTCDTERTTATFVKYGGAQCGEIDWRPIETIPEDYYAF